MCTKGTKGISRTLEMEHTVALGLKLKSHQEEQPHSQEPKSRLLRGPGLLPRLALPSPLLSKVTKLGSFCPFITSSEKALDCWTVTKAQDMLLKHG